MWTPNDFGVLRVVSDLQVLKEGVENAGQEFRVKLGNFFEKLRNSFCPEELTVVLTCMETAQNTRYTENTSTTHNSAGICLTFKGI